VAIAAVLVVVIGWWIKSRDKQKAERITLATLNTKMDMMLANQNRQDSAVAALETRIRVLGASKIE